MAVDNHKGDIQHSLYGMSWGLDGRKLGVLGSPALGGGGDIRYGTETLGTTVASTLAPAGTSILSSSNSAVYELIPPQASMVGVRKRVFSATTGATAQLIKLTAGNFLATLTSGSSGNTISLTTRGAYVDLEYLTTAFVGVMLQTTSSAISNVSITTTT